MTGYLMDGGWMMLPLLVCSITLLAVIIDRVRAFRAAAKCDPVKTRREVREALEANDLDRAVKACEDNEGPVAAVMLTGINRLRRMVERGKGPQEIGAGVTKAMEDYAPKPSTSFTVSFSGMAGAAGLDPGAVAGGISEALITTAAGLIIAIPGVVAYNMFQKRVEEWNLQLEGAITDFIESFA